MPALTIPDVPPEVYGQLQDRAAATGRPVEPVAAEALADWAFRPGTDDTGPLDFPSLLVGPNVRTVRVRFVGERLPVPPPNRDTTPE